MKILPIFFIFFVFPLVAYDGRPSCYKDLERNFFQYSTTAEALSLWRVDQGQWSQIVKIAQDKQASAEQIISEKARKYTPNPLEHPFQTDIARDLLHETMFQIFERSVLEGGFYDTVSIGKMFEYIWTHEERVRRCLGSSTQPH